MAMAQSPLRMRSESPRRMLGERLARVDLQQGDVGGRVAADDLGRDGASAVAVLVGAEVDLDLAGAFDDVVVGQDVAVGRDDEAGAAAALAPLVIFFRLLLLAARAGADRSDRGRRTRRDRCRTAAAALFARS